MGLWSHRPPSRPLRPSHLIRDRFDWLQALPSEEMLKGSISLEEAIIEDLQDAAKPYAFAVLNGDAHVNLACQSGTQKTQVRHPFSAPVPFLSSLALRASVDRSLADHLSVWARRGEQREDPSPSPDELQRLLAWEALEAELFSSQSHALSSANARSKRLRRRRVRDGQTNLHSEC
jgi:hypothetical protein